MCTSSAALQPHATVHALLQMYGEFQRQCSAPGALPRAGRIYLTRLHRPFEGDTRFPELDNYDWKAIAREDFPPGGDRDFGYSFLTLVRRGGSADVL